LKDKDIYNTYILFLENAKIRLKNKTILDIGCGFGIFLNMLDSTNKRYGIDISDYAIRETKKLENINCLLANLNTLDSIDKLNGTKFDIITMFDIIEHCYNFEFLERIMNENLNI
jgi:2-polyprenyl-3-methyl-5-hydroxy-6-metoxy-1,4-benzoquinol methylase